MSRFTPINPALETLQSHRELIRKATRNPALEALQSHRELIQQATRNPALEALQSHRELIRKATRNPALEALQSHRELIRNLLQTPVLGLNNKQMNALGSKKENLIDKFNLKDAVEIIPEITVNLENLYESIQDKEIESTISKEYTHDLKIILKDFIISLYQLKETLNIINTSVIWDILNKAAIILTIYSSLFGGINIPEIINDVKTELNDSEVEKLRKKEHQLEINKVRTEGHKV